MATTTNYGWTKPVVGGDLDVWGGEINTDLDSIDAVVHGIDVRAIPAASATVPKINGTAAVGVDAGFSRGDHVHPTDTTRAAVSAIPAPSASTPLMDGTAAAGTGAAYARSDHVHPIDVSRYAASNPAGYITAAGAPVQSVAGRTGVVTLTHTDITDWTTALSGYALVGSGAQPSTVAPAMDGVATVGVGTTFARSDHVHPSDTSKYSTTNPSNYINQTQARTAMVDGSNAAAGNIGEYLIRHAVEQRCAPGGHAAEHHLARFAGWRLGRRGNYLHRVHRFGQRCGWCSDDDVSDVADWELRSRPGRICVEFDLLFPGRDANGSLFLCGRDHGLPRRAGAPH